MVKLQSTDYMWKSLEYQNDFAPNEDGRKGRPNTLDLLDRVRAELHASSIAVNDFGQSDIGLIRFAEGFVHASAVFHYGSSSLELSYFRKPIRAPPLVEPGEIVGITEIYPKERPTNILSCLKESLPQLAWEGCLEGSPMWRNRRPHFASISDASPRPILKA